jgi:hypothetical protein
MEIRTSDRVLAYLTLLCGLTISAVAIWYSVAGLVAIFAAAAIPIIVMGTVLEVSKLVATVWLKWNWKRAPALIKLYLLTAIVVLMLLTSMGIFGFLSKAHLDQAVPTGDVAAKVALIDEKIKTERDNIEAARRALSQMDAQVDQVLGRTEDARGAERAVQIRRNQARERTNLQNEIAKSQAVIAKLNEERAPIASELRAVEAKVGPIKYIAALIYGDNPDENLLEKSVRWVIIIIVLVFDPLAVILLLASQYSFQWFRQKEDEDKKDKELPPEPEPEDTGYVQGPWPFIVEDTPKEKIEPVVFKEEAPIEKSDPELKSENIDDKEAAEEALKWAREQIEEVTPPTSLVQEEISEDEIPDNISLAEKEAMKRWKEENPNDSLKHQRRLFEMKIIDKLPWSDYLTAKPDYVQNEEQSTETIWQRLKNIKK